MVKIKSIKINGIRGIKNEQLDDAISPKIITLNEKHMFLLGENGTGKSSLYDALEWCITGSCEESNNRSMICNEYLKNDESSFSPELITQINFDAFNLIKRELTSKTTCYPLIILPEGNEINHDCSDSSFIDVNRINKFVLDGPSNLWKAFSDLLNFNNIRIFENKLIKLTKELENKLNNSETTLTQKKSLKTEKEESLKSVKDMFLEKLGDAWETEIETIYESKNDLINYKNLKLSLELCYSKLKEYNEYENKIIELDKEKKSISEIIDELKIKVIDSAERYFSNNSNIDVCPVCKSTIDSEKVRKELIELKYNNKKSLEIIKNLETINSLKKETTSKLKNLFDKIFSLLLLVKIVDSKPITFEEQIKYLKLEEENLLKSCETKNSIDVKIIENYKIKISDLKRLEKEIESLEKKHNKINESYTDISSVKKKFCSEYKDSIKKELDALSNSLVSEVYNMINQSNNDEHIDGVIIDVNKLDEKNPEISFKVKIGDSTKDAINYLSTGHLKCLGFALLVAKFLIKDTKIKTLVIDDPIYAIDTEHRYNLIKYFHELSNKGIQLIIMSSDRLFHEILINSFNNSNYYSFETTWTQQEGVNYKQTKGNFLNISKEHLRKKDIRSTSLYARLSLENCLFNIAKKIKLKIPYGARIGMRQLVDDYNIETKLYAFLKEKDKTEFIDDLKDLFIELKEPKCSKVLLGSFALDQELHHVTETRDSYTTTETNEIINLLERFMNKIKELNL